ncbi:MAG: HPF/RaiA family ribosome-associated protein, partial [Rothia dentocariosa]
MHNPHTLEGNIVEVNIYGRNIKISDRLREYVEEKVEKFEQLGDNVSDIDVKV